MNIFKIIEALEDAKKNRVTHIRDKYHDNNSYCAVGWLVRYTGVSEDIIGDTYIDPDDWDDAKKYYDLESLADIVGLNDSEWHSWDDAIEYYKGLQEENNDTTID